VERLLTLKQSLLTLEDLDFTMDSDEEDDEDSLGLDQEDLLMMDAMNLWTGASALDEGDSHEDSDEDHLIPTKLPAKRLASASKSSTKESRRPNKKRKTAPTDGALPIFDLEEPEFAPSKKSSHKSVAFTTSDSYGESTSLDHTDAVDKSASRKSLRFHTSKIESASARRQGARNNAMGGDDDIPYRERAKEKANRELKDVKARLQRQGGADLDDVDPEPRKKDDSDAGSDQEDMEGDDGYYDLVKRSVKAKKEQKKAEYEAAHP
jgi:U3 small nucleolar RNA-associated protein 3